MWLLIIISRLGKTCLDYAYQSKPFLVNAKNNDKKGNAPMMNWSGMHCFPLTRFTFDSLRIHYPLPLPYAGKPDPRALQEEIRSLRAEMRGLKQQQRQSGGDHRLEKVVKELVSFFSVIVFGSILDERLKKKSWNPERVHSVVTLSLCVCARATVHTFWPWNFHFYAFYGHYSIFPYIRWL